MNPTNSSLPYRIGKFLSSNKLLTVGAIAAGGILWFSMGNAPALNEKNSQPAPVVAARLDPLEQYCGPGLAAAVKVAVEAMKNHEYQKANATLDRCSGKIRKDSDAYKLYLKANQAYVSDLESKREAERKADLAKRKKEGVSVGMTQQNVLDSSWGKPIKINRTTNAFGTHEQWVYNGGYLYFDDGILTSIQN